MVPLPPEPLGDSAARWSALMKSPARRMRRSRRAARVTGLSVAVLGAALAFVAFSPLGASPPEPPLGPIAGSPSDAPTPPDCPPVVDKPFEAALSVTAGPA